LWLDLLGWLAVSIKKKKKKSILTWHSAYEGFTAYIYRIHLLVLFCYYISQGCICWHQVFPVPIPVLSYYAGWHWADTFWNVKIYYTIRKGWNEVHQFCVQSDQFIALDNILQLSSFICNTLPQMIHKIFRSSVL
jgi:hypothetical protein